MSEPSRRIYRVLPLLAILAFGAFLLLFHLDNRPFWQDEAETAGLAKNVLTYGVPRAYDGVNIISQEHGHEYDRDYLWRWSPWLQIYVAAAAFKTGGLTTYAGRLPFAMMGLACIWLVYYVVKRNFGNHAWALLAAALLTCSVPFLIYARQCRYYSLGALLTMISLYAFEEDWESKFTPALVLCLSTGLLFHTNYLLFFTFVVPAFLAAIWLYPQKLPLKRTALVILAIFIIILPGFFLFRIEAQSKIINLALIPRNLEQYFGGFLQYLIPIPIAAYLLWKWGRVFWSRAAIPQDPGEKFVLFLSLIILGNILCLSPAPQCEHRYLMHLYPLCAIILGWIILQTWRYYKVAGVLLGLLLLFTNWLYIVPMDWLTITNRPTLNDRNMLTSPNLPLKLFLTELVSGYPDVNRNYIQFFLTHAHRGDTILTTYGDLPLQFYTPFRVVGGLQAPISLSQPPDWVVPRWVTRWNRSYHLNESERFIKEKLPLATGYQRIVLPFPDDEFGNIADPYAHRFIPDAKPLAQIEIYKKLGPHQNVR